MFEKDLKYLDIFSINRLLEVINTNKKIWKNYKRKLKTMIQHNDISMNEIISKEQKKSNETQFFIYIRPLFKMQRNKFRQI